MMNRLVEITSIGGRKCNPSLKGQVSVRGNGKKKPKPTTCMECREKISIGESYFWLGSGAHLCAGCVGFENDS